MIEELLQARGNYKTLEINWTLRFLTYYNQNTAIQLIKNNLQQKIRLYYNCGSTCTNTELLIVNTQKKGQAESARLQYNSQDARTLSLEKCRQTKTAS